jgi:hypothetical protein
MEASDFVNASCLSIRLELENHHQTGEVTKMVSTASQQVGRGKEDRSLGTESSLEAHARSELRGSAYTCVRGVACRLRDGVLTLHGRVPTYFHKQVAQAIVLQRLDGSVAIDNQLRVVGRN